MLSGYTDLNTVTDAINRGAIYRFLTKPWNDDELRKISTRRSARTKQRRSNAGPAPVESGDGGETARLVTIQPGRAGPLPCMPGAMRLPASGRHYPRRDPGRDRPW